MQFVCDVIFVEDRQIEKKMKVTNGMDPDLNDMVEGQNLLARTMDRMDWEHSGNYRDVTRILVESGGGGNGLETKRKKVKAKRGPRTMNERSGPKTKGTLLDYFVLSSSLKGGLEPLGRKRGACAMDLIATDDLDPVEEIKRRRFGSQKLRGCQI